MGMGLRITVKRPALDQGPTDRTSFVRRHAGVLFTALLLSYLWVCSDFARSVFWNQTTGIITSPGTTTEPTIRFESIDGVSHSFSEDYVKRRPFLRSFHQGEIVQVVYDPARPERALVHDWTLFVNRLGWLLSLGMTLLILAMKFTGKSRMSLRIGQLRADQQMDETNLGSGTPTQSRQVTGAPREASGPFSFRLSQRSTTIPLSKVRIPCPQCQGEVKVPTQVKRIEDFYGARCANCGRPLTKEDIRHWSEKIANHMLV